MLPRITRVDLTTKIMKNVLRYAIVLGLVMVIPLVIYVLDVQLARNNSNLALLNEALKAEDSFLTGTRVRLACYFGGLPHVITTYSERSALELAAEKGRIRYLKHAFNCTTIDEVAKVFQALCAENSHKAIKSMQVIDPNLRCDTRSILDDQNNIILTQ